MGVENANSRTVDKFLNNFLNDTDVTQQKFISQHDIEDETWIHNFDSESEQQSMQWKERIGQNCHFIILFNSSYLQTKWKMTTTAKMHIIFIVQNSYCAWRVLDRPSYMSSVAL